MKMKNKIFFLGLIALVSMTMMSCMSVTLNNGKDGKDTTPTQVPVANQVTAMQPFDQVEVAGAFKVIYEQGEKHSVRIEADEQAMKEMTVYVKEGELRIRQAVNRPKAKLENVKLYVTSPAIDNISIAGSGMFTASQPISSNDLDSEIAGSGQILLVAVNGEKSTMQIAGSGSIEIGQLDCRKARAEIAGSGDVNLGTLKCKDFNIEIAGSGDVNCEHIDADNVHTDIAGSGDVNIKGNVRHSSKDIVGSGKVNITVE